MYNYLVHPSHVCIYKAFKRCILIYPFSSADLAVQIILWLTSISDMVFFLLTLVLLLFHFAYLIINIVFWPQSFTFGFCLFSYLISPIVFLGESFPFDFGLLPFAYSISSFVFLTSVFCFWLCPFAFFVSDFPMAAAASDSYNATYCLVVIIVVNKYAITGL